MNPESALTDISGSTLTVMAIVYTFSSVKSIRSKKNTDALIWQRKSCRNVRKSLASNWIYSFKQSSVTDILFFGWRRCLLFRFVCEPVEWFTKRCTVLSRVVWGITLILHRMLFNSNGKHTMRSSHNVNKHSHYPSNRIWFSYWINTRFRVRYTIRTKSNLSLVYIMRSKCLTLH